MITDRLIEGIIAMQNPTCVGLDTLFDYLPDEMKAGVKSFDGVAERVFEFNKKIIDSVYDIVPSVKVQIAYYEMYGVAGMKAYEETLKYAAEKGLVVIADAKRNDIGSTAACYAKTFLGETQVNDNTAKAFPSDFVTVNGYLGTDGIAPFVDECQKHDKGIFVLVKTSNPSGAEIQNMILENGTPMRDVSPYIITASVIFSVSTFFSASVSDGFRSEEFWPGVPAAVARTASMSRMILFMVFGICLIYDKDNSFCPRNCHMTGKSRHFFASHIRIYPNP